ncbi:MAG: hypothetical protein Q8N26_22575 [Myxococcales bacterium]|nr:hypothetical protein [Myxococcales bacterium]
MRALLIVPLIAACSPPPAPVVTPSDDPSDWVVDATKTWKPVLGEPRWLVPGPLVPAAAKPVLASNNNVDLVMHGGRLWMGWRTAPSHFASAETRLHVMSSGDLGQSWRFETTVFQGADMREPLFLSMGGVLRFHWFEAGSDPFSFEPRQSWRITLGPDGRFSEPERWAEPKHITWSLEVRGGVAWRTSYSGTHYMLGLPSDLSLAFTTSTDGVTWLPVAGDGVVYRGGVSEAAFEFDADGNLWAVTRNEDGDATGFGSHVCFAARDALGSWSCSAKSDPHRYDSPKLFRHGSELFLVARRNPSGPFDQGRDELSFAQQQTAYLAAYSASPKRTALYRLDRERRRVEWLFDLPSSGDTAFPSVVRVDAHRFLIANYTSPVDFDVDRSWLTGQTIAAGTKLYLVELAFEPQ